MAAVLRALLRVGERVMDAGYAVHHALYRRECQIRRTEWGGPAWTGKPVHRHAMFPIAHDDIPF